VRGCTSSLPFVLCLDMFDIFTLAAALDAHA
jgi:hypothetical protein